VVERKEKRRQKGQKKCGRKERKKEKY